VPTGRAATSALRAARFRQASSCAGRSCGLAFQSLKNFRMGFLSVNSTLLLESNGNLK
jgi:hypothetical protein